MSLVAHFHLVRQSLQNKHLSVFSYAGEGPKPPIATVPGPLRPPLRPLGRRQHPRFEPEMDSL
jgi:hypothetical protein